MRTVELTPRERDVARELAFDGATNEEIADRLEVSVHTVASHLKAVYMKTGIRNRAGLAVALVRKRVVVQVVLPPGPK